MRYVSDPPAFTYSTLQSGCYIVVVVCRFPKDHCNRTILWSSMCFCLVAYAHVKIVCIICFSGGSLQTTAYTVHDGQSTNTVPWWNVAHLYIRLDFAYQLTLFFLSPFLSSCPADRLRVRSDSFRVRFLLVQSPSTDYHPCHLQHFIPRELFLASHHPHRVSSSSAHAWHVLNRHASASISVDRVRHPIPVVLPNVGGDLGMTLRASTYA